jgi:protein involved in polysaccharide export with SLBB domain
MKLYPLPALILCLTVLLSAQVDPTLLQNLGNNSSSMGAFATMENSDKQALLEAFFLSDTFSGLSSQNKFKNDSLSPLFLHPDSALIIPFDTIHTAKDSQTSTQHLRFSRRIFHTIDPSVFSSATNAVSPSYPIKPGDQLVVSSWGETEFEQEVLVNNQGSFFLKNIGLIPVAGLTLAQAQQAVTLRMSKHYSSIKRNRTQVNVRLSKLSPIKVFIMGQVQKPGAYMFYGNTSVLQALYFAQGPTDIGSVRNIIVKRDSTEFTFDLYEYLFAGNTTPPTILLDGDVIILPRASILVAAYGDIGDQGIFELTPQEGLKHLLQYSSGINPTAGRENIQIQRINELGAYDHEQIALSKILQDSSFTFNMQDGDIVFIPTSSFTGTMNVTIQGAVAYPGTYKYSQGQTAMDLIRTAGSLQEHAYADRLQVIRSDAEGNQELFSFTLNTAQQFALSHQDTLIVYSKKTNERTRLCKHKRRSIQTWYVCLF